MLLLQAKCIPNQKMCSKISVLFQGLWISEAPSKCLQVPSCGSGDLYDAATDVLARIVKMSSICAAGCSLFNQGWSSQETKGLLNLFFQIWIGWDVDYCGSSVVRIGNKRMSMYFQQKFYLEEDFPGKIYVLLIIILLACWKPH